MFEDKTLVCKDCGKEFVWTAGEQEFYASRGFENQPQRCKPCRDARKNGGARSAGAGSQSREMRRTPAHQQSKQTPCRSLCKLKSCLRT